MWTVVVVLVFFPFGSKVPLRFLELIFSWGRSSFDRRVTKIKQIAGHEAKWD